MIDWSSFLTGAYVCGMFVVAVFVLTEPGQRRLSAVKFIGVIIAWPAAVLIGTVFAWLARR